MAMEAWEQLLGGWEGFELVSVEEHPAGPDQPVAELMLRLRARPDHAKRCSRCGEPVVEIHEVTGRRVRDLSDFEWKTWIVFPGRASSARGAARPWRRRERAGAARRW